MQEHARRHGSRPGDQGVNYLSNPGEAWAEAYARLTFPTQAWTLHARCCARRRARRWPRRPTSLQPWTKRVSADLHRHGDASFKLPITLDGAFTLQLDGPAGTNYDIVLKSGGKVLDRTSKRNSSDRIHYRIACRDRRTENLQITVVRRSGEPAPYTLTAKYAG